MEANLRINEIIAQADALLAAGDDAGAEKMLVEAIDRYAQDEPDQVVAQSVLCNELGGFYRSRGIFDKGEEAYLRAKALLEQLRGYVSLADGPVSDSGCCACNPYSGCGDARQVSRSRREVFCANETTTSNYATVLNNLAGLYRMSGQLQKAADLFDRAIQVYETCSDSPSPDHIASSYNNKGLVYLDMRETDKARFMFLKAKEILERGGDYNFELGTTLSNLGFSCVMEKKYPEAAALFRQAEGLFERAGSREMVCSCQKILSQLEAGQ